jgi:hypothetical protein
MNDRRLEAGDQENTDFEVLRSDLHHVKAGFDFSQPAEAPEGARRFPRRSADDEVPKESLAERVRRGHRKGK